MSHWTSTRARHVLAALERIGWKIKRQRGSHRVLERSGRPIFVFAFHDREEIGPKNADANRAPYRTHARRPLTTYQRRNSSRSCARTCSATAVRADLMANALALNALYIALGVAVFLYSVHVARRRGLPLQMGE